MQWVAVSVITTCEAQEGICQILYEAGAKGAVIKGDKVIRITVYFPSKDGHYPDISYIKRQISELSKYGINTGNADVLVECIEDEDWVHQWKKNYKPIRITPNLIVKPTWKDIPPDPGDVIIELDPGMAFGSGTHFTTRSCLSLLEKHVKKGNAVLDVGTGAGILAISASKLGALNVLALDIDEVAIEVAKQNIEQNDVADRVVLKNASPDQITLGKYDVVVINIVAEVIIKLLPYMSKALKEKGLLIAAGIIPERMERVQQAFTREGLLLVESVRDENWITVIYGKGRDEVA